MENKETQNIRVVTNVKDIKLKKLREEIANLEIEKENLKFEKFNDSAWKPLLDKLRKEVKKMKNFHKVMMMSWILILISILMIGFNNDKIKILKFIFPSIGFALFIISLIMIGKSKHEYKKLINDSNFSWQEIDERTGLITNKTLTEKWWNLDHSFFIKNNKNNDKLSLKSSNMIKKNFEAPLMAWERQINLWTSNSFLDNEKKIQRMQEINQKIDNLNLQISKIRNETELF